MEISVLLWFVSYSYTWLQGQLPPFRLALRSLLSLLWVPRVSLSRMKGFLKTPEPKLLNLPNSVKWELCKESDHGQNGTNCWGDVRCQKCLPPGDLKATWTWGGGQRMPWISALTSFFCTGSNSILVLKLYYGLDGWASTWVKSWKLCRKGLAKKALEQMVC